MWRDLELALQSTHANRYPPFELVPTCHVHYVCIRSTSKEEIPFRQERLSSRCFSPAVRCVCILQTLQVCCRLHIGVMLHAALPSSSDAQNACFLCERGPRTVGGGRCMTSWLKSRSGVGWRPTHYHFGGVPGGSPAKKILGLRLSGNHFCHYADGSRLGI